MISNRDLKAAARTLPAGEPPTGEEIEAYLNGELSAEAAEILQERLAHFPDLARVLAEPFPILEDVEVRTEERALRFWRTSAVAASIMAAAFGGLLLQTQSKARRQAKEQAQPTGDIDNALLLPDGQRGKPSDERPIPLPAAGENLLLIPALINQPQFRDYRIDIVDLNGATPRTIWSRTDQHRRSDDTFEILIPRTFLRPGHYQVVVYGIDGTTERLAKYTVRVPRRPDHGAS